MLNKASTVDTFKNTALPFLSNPHEMEGRMKLCDYVPNWLFCLFLKYVNRSDGCAQEPISTIARIDIPVEETHGAPCFSIIGGT